MKKLWPTKLVEKGGVMIKPCPIRKFKHLNLNCICIIVSCDCHLARGFSGNILRRFVLLLFDRIQVNVEICLRESST
jgi:hypothetical protein